MNCDQVFEALTDPKQLDAARRGPSFETAELDEHLARCRRCRELKQVLEPALSLLCGDLPAEVVPSPRPKSPTDDPHSPFLSVESVGLADALAAQLLTSSAQRPPVSGAQPARGSQRLISPPTRRLIGGFVRSTALVVFGGLAVYCVGARERNVEPTSAPTVVPAVAPAVVPGQTCTRSELKRGQGLHRDARSVILTCVACHLQERQPHRPLSATWPHLRTPDRSTASVVVLASRDETVQPATKSIAV